MSTRSIARLTLLLSALVLGLAGCGTAAPSMMSGGHRASSGTWPSPWQVGSGVMMGGVPQGYHLRTPSCSPPSTLPGTNVAVVLGDMGMTHMMGGIAPYGSRMMLHASPSRVKAGTVTFVVANAGWRTHELVVLPLATGTSAGHRTVGVDGRVSEAGSLGEASASCAAGAGSGIRSGAVGWVTLTLPAGTYELACNRRHHYAAGMWQRLVVG